MEKMSYYTIGWILQYAIHLLNNRLLLTKSVAFAEHAVFRLIWRGFKFGIIMFKIIHQNIQSGCNIAKQSVCFTDAFNGRNSTMKVSTVWQILNIEVTLITCNCLWLTYKRSKKGTLHLFNDNCRFARRLCCPRLWFWSKRKNDLHFTNQCESPNVMTWTLWRYIMTSWLPDSIILWITL